MTSGPHFFKLIFEETLEGKKLQLPKKFRRLYGETLSQDVFLELPCGSTWKMGLKSSVGCCNKVWLEEGWQEFANHYSLKRGHLLMFKYEGNSRFHVVICDMTTCEIAYPTNPFHDHKPNDDINGENWCRKGKDTEEEDFQSPSPSSLPTKRMRTSPGGTSQSNSSSPRPNGTRFSLLLHRKHGVFDKGDGEKSTIERKSKFDLLRGMKRLTEAEKAKALDMASGFKSRNPNFKLVMQPSYVLCSCLKIPTQFARQYLKVKACEVKLKVGTRTWSVNYSFGVSDKSWPTPRFNNGWRKFSEDNCLDIGDVCTFVLAKDTAHVSFEVVIFRAKTNANPSLSPAHQDRRSPTNETDTDSLEFGFPDETDIPGPSNSATKQKRGHVSSPRKSNYPCFEVVMQPSYTNSTSYLPVPYDFAKRHIKKKQDHVVLRTPNGRSWSAEYKIKKPKKGVSETAALYGGWRAFAVDNNLEVGDVCFFELVNETNILLQVSIVRLVDDDDDDAFQELSQGCEAAPSLAKLKRSVRVKAETDCSTDD